MLETPSEQRNGHLSPREKLSPSLLVQAQRELLTARRYRTCDSSGGGTDRLSNR